MLHVMEMHWEKVEEITRLPEVSARGRPQRCGTRCWPTAARYGFRNAQATVLAPTGTISFMMDCDTTGIEPDIALVKYKQLAGGGMLKIVNQTVPLALQTLGLRRAADRSRSSAYIDKHDTIEGARRPEARAPAGVRLCLPAAQRHAVDRLAGPHPDDGRRAAVPLRGDLEDGEHARETHAGRHRRRLHGRLAAGPEGPGDLPRRLEGEPAALDQAPKADKAAEKLVAAPRRERLPDTRQSITHKFSIAGHEGYITVGLYPDGRPGELFITMAKEGSTIGGLMDCFGTAVSMSLQYGVPLEVYVNKFSHTRFEPMGYTKNPDIRIAKSMVDYIFRWLGITFLPGYREANRTVAASRARPHGSGRRGDRAGPAATKAGGPNAGQGSAKKSLKPASEPRQQETEPPTAAARTRQAHRHRGQGTPHEPAPRPAPDSAALLERAERR